MHKKEIVTDCITFKKHLRIRALGTGLLTELQGAAIPFQAGAVHHQPVDDLRLGQVGGRLLHSEHILAEMAAVPLELNPPGANRKLVAGRKDPQLVSLLNNVKEIALVGIAACHQHKILHTVCQLAMKAYIFLHGTSCLSLQLNHHTIIRKLNTMRQATTVCMQHLMGQMGQNRPGRL